MKLTEKHIRQNDKIPTSEIEQDVVDTQKEIDLMKEELVCLNRRGPENKTKIYLLNGQILSRKDFIEDLQCILNYRKNAKK